MIPKEHQSRIEEALTKGLQAGYTGKSEFDSTQQRGSFPINRSHYQEGDMTYHDEWVDGGGQELIQIGDLQFTRVYAGTTIDQEMLEQLGITKGKITEFLMRVIADHGSETRLFTDFELPEQDIWAYSYQITDIDPDVGVVSGKEKILYQGQVVFVHTFSLSQVRS
jgi:hypothetical protein